MTNQDYKNFIETEILKGIIFNEDSYNVDAGEHFELAPNDIVTLDIGSYGKKIIADMKAFKNAKYSQVEIDDTTKEVTINGQPLQSDSSGGQAGGAGQTSGQKMEPQTRSSVVDFLKLLKANGALDKLKDLDPATKQKIAGEILKLIQGDADASSPTQSAAPEATANGGQEESIKNNVMNVLQNDEAGKKVAHGNPKNLETIANGAANRRNAQEIVDDLRKVNGGTFTVSDDIKHVIGKALGEVGRAQDTSGLTESTMWLLKESYIILSETDNSNAGNSGGGVPSRAEAGNALNKRDTTNGSMKPSAAPPNGSDKGTAVADPPADPSVSPPADITKDAGTPPKADGKDQKDPQPAAASGVDPNATLGQLEKSNPEDPKVAHYIKLKNNYLKLAKIFGNSINPGSTVLAKVKQPDGQGMVSVVRMKKKGTDQTGKSTYETDADAEAFDVPVTNDVVKKRMPVEQAKKTGLLARIFGG
jgi:hypothetical protein